MAISLCCFPGLDSSLEGYYMLNNPPPPPPPLSNLLGFADALHCQEMGPNELICNQETELQQRSDVENVEKKLLVSGAKSKRKRARSKKTSEQVESQRMTHIAVERNRRKQMNQHLNILRSLMPNSYVQRGDQASIIGGAIEFVRELEQLLECLESQKRQRIFGDESLKYPLPTIPTTTILNDDQMGVVGYEDGTQDETSERETCFGNVRVKVIGFDGSIKILSRRKGGLLVQTIAALEDLKLHILHTAVTTIEQSILYSFNFKMSGETRLTAEDLADSVQQILCFIQTNSTTSADS